MSKISPIPIKLLPSEVPTGTYENPLFNARIDIEASWTAVAKGAALIGLGVGCEIPPSMTRCPIHLGVVLSRPVSVRSSEPSQTYTDSFDHSYRIRNDITWIVAKGDLITPDGIDVSLKIIKKITRTGRKAGTVVIVSSSKPGEPPSQYGEVRDGTYSTARDWRPPMRAAKRIS